MTEAPWRCTNCGLPYPAEGLPHRCPRCGGLFDRPALPAWPALPPRRANDTMWRYRALLPVPPGAEPVTLGEGGTPLLPGPEPGVWLKAEYANPTGSHKDRAASVVFTWLQARGIPTIVEDSSGNAGAAWAAYAARSGITAHIFVPQDASGPKQDQIVAYGARLHRVPGPRRAARQAAEEAAARGLGVYASHAWLPMALDGYATIAYEIVEQLGQGPAAVVAPVGHGALFVGLMRGFAVLQQAGIIPALPQGIAVQALACAPLWAMSHGGFEAWLLVSDEAETAAEGVRVKDPVWGNEVAAWVHRSRGAVAAVDEAGIAAARDFLARRGFYITPTAALAWAAFGRLRETLPRPVVLVLTAAGHKTRPTAAAEPVPQTTPQPKAKGRGWWSILRRKKE